MHSKKTFLLLSLVLALSGCSSTDDKPASVEERNAESQRLAAQKAAADKTAAEKAAAEKAAAEKAAAEKAAAEKAVEVKPVTLEAATGKPLDGTEKPEAAALIEDSIKDPKSELAKRVIYFDYDSAVLKDEYQGLLELHARYLKKFKDAKVFLQGHTDDRGSREYNLALGQRRADAVRKALSLLGVPDAQVEAVSFGEEKPATPGEGEEMWTKNRRAELRYQGE